MGTRSADMSSRTHDSVVVGEELPPVIDPIDYTRVVMNAGATMDFFPGHHDPEFARSQGQPTIFLNTMHVAGFIDRVVGEWAGPRSRVVRRKMTVLRSIYAGDEMIATGRVTGTRLDDSTTPPRRLVDLAVEISTAPGQLCAPAEVTIELLD